ncbi:MAG: leucine-rich repeat protein [Lachnospiraceae bacterium]|jgi:competence protein ComEC|nr:leucine-rich repeat protein [Lachnospiraceae bacterium]
MKLRQEETETMTRNVLSYLKEAVNWCFDPYTGCLTVSGTGPMANQYEAGVSPWQSLADEIRQVVIEQGVTTVGDYAFYGCKNLTDVSIADTVEQIGVFSFAFCPSLVSVTLPEGVRVIAAKAFRCCPSLEMVSLPESLTNIDMRAFSEDSALARVHYGGCKAQWDQILVSMAVSDNRYLLQADIHFMGPEKDVRSTKSSVDRYEEMITAVKGVLQQGGDGKLYVMAVNLTTPNIRAKSGDCTLLIFPDGQTMMIDCGYTDCSGHIISLLKDLELGSLDYFVLSHTHIDHAGGMPALSGYIYDCADGRIRNYYRSEYVDGQIEPAFLSRLREEGAHIVTDVKAGTRWQVGDVTIDVLSPLQKQIEAFTGTETEINNLSVLMKITYGESVYLTGGDIYRSQEQELIDIYGNGLRADVAKASHHGTHTSSSEEWLSAVSPAVIFAPAEDIGGTPLAESAAKRGIAYYSVGLDGIVLISLDAHRDCKVICQYDSVLRKGRMASACRTDEISL